MSTSKYELLNRYINLLYLYSFLLFSDSLRSQLMSLVDVAGNETITSITSCLSPRIISDSILIKMAVMATKYADWDIASSCQGFGSTSNVVSNPFSAVLPLLDDNLHTLHSTLSKDLISNLAFFLVQKNYQRAKLSCFILSLLIRWSKQSHVFSTKAVGLLESLYLPQVSYIDIN